MTAKRLIIKTYGMGIVNRFFVKNYAAPHKLSKSRKCSRILLNPDFLFWYIWRKNNAENDWSGSQMRRRL